MNHPHPIAFIPLAVDTTGRMYDEFIRLLFLHAHREASALDNELPKESDKFHFLHVSCFANLKGVVGLIMVKVSVMWISIPLDLSSRSFIPIPCFIRSRLPTPLLTPSLVSKELLCDVGKRCIPKWDTLWIPKWVCLCSRSDHLNTGSFRPVVTL